MAPSASDSGRLLRQRKRRREAPKTPLLGGDIGRAAYRRRVKEEARAEMASYIPSLTAGLAVIYTLAAAFAPLVAPRDQLAWLIPILAGTAFVFYLVRLGLVESDRASRSTLGIMLLVAILTLIGAATMQLVTGDPIHAMPLVIISLAAGFLILDLASLIMVESFVAATLGIAVWGDPTNVAWFTTGVSASFAIGVAFVVNRVRMRGVRRLAELRIADERHKTVLSRSFNEAQESETRFRMLSGAAFEGILALRGETIRDINPAGAEIFGRTPAQLVGTSVSGIGRTEDGRTLVEALTGGDEVDEFTFQTTAGNLIDLEARSRRTRFRGEDTLAVTLRDVTERRRHEAERARLNRELTLILESTGEGILGLDRDGRVGFANPAAANALGRPSEAIVGQAHKDLLHSGSACPADCPIRDTLDNAQTEVRNADHFTTPSGKIVPVDWVSAPMIEDGEVIGAVVAFRDISERLEVERLKDQFVSVVSHELKTPLTSMQGALKLVDSGRLGELPPQAARMVHIATDNTTRLIRLVQDILDVERFRAGRVMLEPTAVDAASLAERAIDTMSALADGRKVRLVQKVRNVIFHADGDRILQALTNLLSNAIKFSPEKGTVTLLGRVDGDHVRFEVQDQGPGIPEDQIERVFERFHQLDSSHARKFGGTGLGLAICRSIADAHGGTIHVESTPGHGSTFILRLPLKGPRISRSDDHTTRSRSGRAATTTAATPAPSKDRP